MTSKSKSDPDRSVATVNLGKARKEKIADFRAKRRLAGAPIPTIHDAVNVLVDRALELELATA